MQYLRTLNKPRLGIIYTENQYLISILNGVRHAAAAGETVTVLDSFNPQDMDFRSTISKIKRNAFDAIGVLLFPGQVSQFYRQMKDQKFEIQTFGTDTFESSTEIIEAKGGMQGAVYVNNHVPPDFRLRYEKTYGNDLQVTYAGNGYDFAVLICEALQAGQTKKDGLWAKLKSSETIHGMLGEYSFVKTPQGDQYFRFPIVVNEVNGKTFKAVSAR